jgi:hypothetical protein
MAPLEYEDYTDEDNGTDYDAMAIDEQYFYDEIQAIRDKYNFYYYHVKLEPGYYEGFSVDIENNFGIAYDSYEDKREAQKEITQIKKFLLECVENGLVCVWPGWCTTYRTPAETHADVLAAVKEMRDEARSIPTWRDYERGEATA